jgi:hypothetical protein
MKVRYLVLFLIALSSACASGSGGGAGGGANVLTAADLEPVPSEILYDTVNRMRPQWLASRAGAPSPTVFIEGVQSGDSSTLRTLTAGRVQEVRFIRAEAATARFGAGYEGGVIEVVLRR